jgi:fructan beta-fructosidase
MSGTQIAILTGAMTGLGNLCFAQPAGTTDYDEPYRPQYHFSAAQGWLGDPDGLIHYKHKFSMFWWGKATSADLVHYAQESPLAMTGDLGNIRYFSGSVVVDKHNSAGFGPNAQVAVYTIVDTVTKNQSQGISYSSDGRTFKFFKGNPVLDIGSTEFRDPAVFWHTPSSKWVMAVVMALERRVKFYSSPDLKTWTWMSDFGPTGAGDKVWECPDLFELPVDGDPSRKKWVMVVSVDGGHERYFVGDFNGKAFTADKDGADPLYVDRGLDFYASRTFRDYDNTLKRTISLGWVANWAYARQAPSVWGKGFWSLPRTLELRTDPDGIRLNQRPIERLQTLRQTAVAFVAPLTEGTTVLPKFAPKQNVYEIDAAFGTDFPNVFGIHLCVGNGRKVAIRYDSRSQILTIDRINSADVPIPNFARETSAPVAPVNHRLRLHIYVDKSSVELFTNDGKEVFTLLTYAGDAQRGIETYAEHAGTVMDFKAWTLKSIWRRP